MIVSDKTSALLIYTLHIHARRLSIHRQSILQLSKVPLELVRRLALCICHNRGDQRIVVVHESVSLPRFGNALAAAAVQTDRHGAAAREGDRETFTSLRHTGQHAREVATYAAISCGWSASRGSRPSPLPQAAHRAGHTPQRPGNRSNCRQTQYRGGRACLQGRRRSLLHR